MQDRGIKELIASVCYPVLHCVVNRAIIKGCNPLHLFRLSMLDRPLILWMKLSVVTTIISWVRRTKVWSPSFNVKIVLLSRATGSVSIGNLSAFDVNCQQSARNCRRRDRRPTAVDIVTNGNEVSCPWQQHDFMLKLGDQTFVPPYSTENRSNTIHP